MFRIRHFIKPAALLGTLALSILSSHAALAHCDRACLADLLTQYVDAVVAHDNTRLPLAGSVKYTVDGQAGMLGEGLWQSVTSAQGFRQDYLDLKQQVGAGKLSECAAN